MSRRIGFAIVKTGLLATMVATANCAAAGTERLSLTGDLVQGALVIGRTLPGTRVSVGDKPVRVSPDGVFVLGFGRNAKKAVVALTYPDGTSERRSLKVRKRKFRVQRIDGLPPRKVTPSAEDLKRIRTEGARIGAARRRDTGSAWFLGGFMWPARGIVSGVFGSQRILNGKPRSPHLGTDVAAPTGTSVVAAGDGIITLADRGMFYTGHTLMVDHGHGVSTIYAHLSALLVKKGDRVRKGQPIGRIGATGRVTGPHLHWGLSLFGQRLDPALAAGPKPKKKARR